MNSMVVDDSRATRTIIARILGELGFTVTQAASGMEAMQKLEQEGIPDLMLVDWNMPEMSGYDLVCAVRAKPDYQKMRMLMVTTETEIERVTSALAAGADEYLMKPFTKEMLIDKLRILGDA
jgi:two-component system, chemotaxis family, chemotaxis protein CheY